MSSPSPKKVRERPRRSAARGRTGWGRVGLLVLLAACGTRTGLFVDDMPGLLDDEADGAADGSRDGARDGGLDAPTDAPDDVIPPLDAAKRDATVKTDCPDADATRVYLISDNNQLLSYAPETNDAKLVGTIACPTGNGSTPFSMAVDRKGVAYVAFSDGHLYRVSTLTAACIGTSFAVNQHGFYNFGMGFAANPVGPTTETLYVAGSNVTTNSSTEGLARIDTTTFQLSVISNGFTPPIHGAELTGTGDGRLYGFYTKTTSNTPVYIGELNTQTAAIVGETMLPGVDRGEGWAFAFWGGDFYTFTAPGGSTVVHRYRPADGSVIQVAQLSTRIVGAGVSTCAPSE